MLFCEMKPHYYGHRQRLKEKFAEYPNSLTDYELVELMLGYVIQRKDVKPIAKDILAKAETIADILTLDMAGIEGAGSQTQIFFASILEFLNRCQLSKAKQKSQFSSASDVYQLLKYSVSMGSRENFVGIFLNAKNELISHKVLNEGTVNLAAVFPREVALAAMEANAVGVIIAHNHPSGDTKPSKEDCVSTKRVKEALETIGVKLLDHVIVGKNGFTSMKDLELI